LWIAKFDALSGRNHGVHQAGIRGGTECKRAENHRNSVVSAVDRALVLVESTLIELGKLALSRQLSIDTGVPPADGAGT